MKTDTVDHKVKRAYYGINKFVVGHEVFFQGFARLDEKYLYSAVTTFRLEAENMAIMLKEQLLKEQLLKEQLLKEQLLKEQLLKERGCVLLKSTVNNQDGIIFGVKTYGIGGIQIYQGYACVMKVYCND